MPPRLRKPTPRCPAHDYAQPGVYFVTCCTHRRTPCLGDVVGGTMLPSAQGLAVWHALRALPHYHPQVQLDACCLMPDHVHALIVFTGRDRSLSEVVRAFKAFSARQANALRGEAGQPFWQRGFHDRIVRDAREHERVRAYIAANPWRAWVQDAYATRHRPW